jgi:predicted nucleic-acid-binding protein
VSGLDTNVLVRWLVEDDSQQVVRTQRMFALARDGNTMLFVPVTVMLELEWVLRSRYRLAKPTVLNAFQRLLETLELEFQEEAALEMAVFQYRQGAEDFADCLHAGLCSAAGKAPMLTFDRGASQVAGVELVAE